MGQGLAPGLSNSQNYDFVNFFFLIRDFLAYALQRTVIPSWSSVWEITLGARMALSTQTSLSHLEE